MPFPYVSLCTLDLTNGAAQFKIWHSPTMGLACRSSDADYAWKKLGKLECIC